MEVTVEEIVQDVREMFNSGQFKLPVTNVTSTCYAHCAVSEIEIHTHNGNICGNELVKIINFYLEKKVQEEEGEITVTTNEDGECVLVSRQDEDHKILKVIWEKK